MCLIIFRMLLLNIFIFLLLSHFLFFPFSSKYFRAPEDCLGSHWLKFYSRLCTACAAAKKHLELLGGAQAARRAVEDAGTSTML